MNLHRTGGATGAATWTPPWHGAVCWAVCGAVHAKLTCHAVLSLRLHDASAPCTLTCYESYTFRTRFVSRFGTPHVAFRHVKSSVKMPSFAVPLAYNCRIYEGCMQVAHPHAGSHKPKSFTFPLAFVNRAHIGLDPGPLRPRPWFRLGFALLARALRASGTGYGDGLRGWGRGRGL